MIYTNHCIRATCIMNLDRKGIGARYIQLKYLDIKTLPASLFYSSRLSKETQFEISKILCESSTKSSIASSSNNKELNFLGDFNLCNDFDVELFLEGLENHELQNVKTAQSMCFVPSVSDQNTGCRFNIQNSTVNINFYANKQ